MGGAWWGPAQERSPDQVDARSSLERRAAADGQDGRAAKIISIGGLIVEFGGTGRGGI